MENDRYTALAGTARVVKIELEEAKNGDQMGTVSLALEPKYSQGPYADQPLLLHVGAAGAGAFELGDEIEVLFNPKKKRRQG